MAPVAPSNPAASDNYTIYECSVPICDILTGSLRKRKNDVEKEEAPEVSRKKFVVSNKEEAPKVARKKLAVSNKEEAPIPVKKELKTASYEEDEENEDYDSDNKTKGSSYEKMIEKKRAERIALLKSMEIDQIKEDISEAITGIKQIKKVTIKRSYKEVPSVEPLRRSKRLANIEVDFSENALEKLAIKNAVAFADSQKQDKSGGKRVKTKTNGKIKRFSYKFQVSQIDYDEPIPSNVTFADALKSASPYEECVSDLHVQEVKYNQKFLAYDKDVLKNMTLNEFNVCKVVPARITSAAWCPSREDLVVAAGDKFGNLGLWKIKDSETNPHLFKVHISNIPHMQFSLYDPTHLITSSYDGTMRCGDLIKHTFNEIYVTDRFRVTWFDFLSPSTYLISHSNGEVALFDKKTKGKTGEKRHECHEFTIKTVSVHPMNKNVFATCDNRKSIRLWDLRKLQRKPVVEILHHRRTVNSAYFSPVTGNSLLSTSLDDSICIFDSKALTEDIKLKVMINHNNFTGQWLTIFRATWLPNSDDLFSVGCMEQPRRIQIYDKDLNLYYNMKDDNLTTVTSVHRFHPYRSVLAGCNSSGKLFVFT